MPLYFVIMKPARNVSVFNTADTAVRLLKSEMGWRHSKVRRVALQTLYHRVFTDYILVLSFRQCFTDSALRSCNV